MEPDSTRSLRWTRSYPRTGGVLNAALRIATLKPLGQGDFGAAARLEPVRGVQLRLCRLL
jgi:hypothetical protein